MTIYRVEDDRAVMKPIETTHDFAEMLAVYPVDLDELERDMMGLEQAPLPVIHHFAPGIYMREARFKAGTFIIGHKHTAPHLNVMLEGHITMADGTGMKAPLAFVAGPGRKSCVVHEDTSWLNVYATDETDIGTLESMFMEKSDNATAQEVAQASAMTEDILDAIADYQAMLSDIGMSADEVASMSRFQDDRVRLPWGAYKFRSAPSPIHGQGIFASADIEPGENIGPANIHGRRTILGWSVNHSGKPNAALVKHGDGLDLVALTKINGNRGGLLGDEILVDYRESRRVALCLVR